MSKKKRSNRSYRQAASNAAYFYSVAGRYASKREGKRIAKDGNLFKTVRSIVEGATHGE